jgi:hypothetical protein
LSLPRIGVKCSLCDIVGCGIIQLNPCKETSCQFVVARGDSTKVFEFVEDLINEIEASRPELYPTSTCGADFAAFFAKNYEDYGQIISDENIKAE